jgi:hypothetical protein
MKWVYTLLATTVVTASSAGMSHFMIDALPKGAPRDAAEKFVLAPGQTVLREIEGEKAFKKLRKKTKKSVKKGHKALDKAADKVDDTLDDMDVEVRVGGLAKETRKWTKIYNVSIWAVVGFALCSVLTLILGVSSAKTAISLGVKVTAAMIFLQAALVLGGILVFQHLRL